MPYLSATADVAPLLPRSVPTFTPTSVPLTLTDLDTIIRRVSAEVDGAAAGAGYSVPVPSTATQAWTQVQQLAFTGVAWQVLRTVFPGQGGTGDRNSQADDYRIAYMEGLKALRRGETALVGAPGDASETNRALPRSAETSGLDVAAGGASPMARMDMVF